MVVAIVSSPYHCVKRGSTGVVEGKKFKGTSNEVWRVRVGRESRLFRPNEIRVLRRGR